MLGFTLADDSHRDARLVSFIYWRHQGREDGHDTPVDEQSGILGIPRRCFSDMPFLHNYSHHNKTHSFEYLHRYLISME